MSLSNGLSHPAAVLARLEELDRDLAERQNDLEDAAWEWFRAKRAREQKRATAFMGADGTVADRNAFADAHCALDAVEAEARWEGLRAVVRVLETRAQIGMSILKSQGRA